jgi:hypothetical protein
MARLNDDAQWIVLMGFIVSFSFFFLAIVINQSTVVGQTTAESVIEFPKNDIRDVRQVIGDSVEGLMVHHSLNEMEFESVRTDIKDISMNRKSAVVIFKNLTNTIPPVIWIHYNNGVTEYNETWTKFY